MKKKLTAAIAVLLAIVMSFSFVTAFAEQKELGEQEPEAQISWVLPPKGSDVTLLSVGDSTSNGYFLNGYVDELCGIGEYAGDDCYPVELYEYLVKIYGEKHVTFNQFCLNGMRTNEFRYILDKALGEGKNPGIMDAFGKDHIESFENSYKKAKEKKLDWIGDPNATDLYDAFKIAVTNADIITIDLGMNNFGTYVCQRLMKDIGMTAVYEGAYEETLIDIKGELNSKFDETTSVTLRSREAETLLLVNPAFNALAVGFAQQAGLPGVTCLSDLLNTFDTLDTATAKAVKKQFAAAIAANDTTGTGTVLFDVIETMTYSFGCVMLNYVESLDYIYEANPDAMVIVNGMYNGMTGMKAVLGETTFPFDTAWGTVLGSVSDFLRGAEGAIAQNPYADDVRFADMKNISIFVDEIKNFSGDPIKNYKGVNAATLGRIIDLAYNLNDNAGGGDLSAVISPALLNGIRQIANQRVYGTLQTNDMATQFLEDQQMQAIAAYVADKMIEGILVNCATEGVITAGNVKKAYAENKMAEFSFDISSLSITQIMAIAGGNYSSLDAICKDPIYSNFAVAMGFETIRTALIKAANLTNVDLGGLFGTLGGGNIMEVAAAALMNYDYPFGDPAMIEDAGEQAAITAKNSAAQALLHVCVRFIGLRGFGTHPDPAGARQKTNAVMALVPEISKESALVDIPTAIEGLTCKNYDQYGIEENEAYTVENGTAQTAGTYTATVKLNDGYVWSDGTYADQEIEWKIEHNFDKENAEFTLADDMSTVTVFIPCTHCGKALEIVYGEDGQNIVDNPDFVPTEHVHSYGDYVYNGDATCKANGTETGVCSECGHKDTREASETKLDHNLSDVVTQPTCTEQGFTTHTCADCDYEAVDTYVKAKGHAWDEGEIITEATYEAAGLRRYHCQNCEAMMDEAIPMLLDKDVEVTVTKSTLNLLFLRYTTYNISTTATGTTVRTVQYSTNNRTWTTGTRFSSMSASSFYIRVTDSDGMIWNFHYTNNEITSLD